MKHVLSNYFLCLFVTLSETVIGWPRFSNLHWVSKPVYLQLWIFFFDLIKFHSVWEPRVWQQ